jgi:hypothetical protein
LPNTPLSTLIVRIVGTGTTEVDILGDEGALVRGGGIIKVRRADEGVASEYDRGTEVIGVSARDIGEFCVLGPSGARAFEDVDGALIIKGSDDLGEVIALSTDEECIAE